MALYPITRRIQFEFDPADVYFADGDMVFSHLVAMLSAFFPGGEDYFVRSVRRFQDEITDPLLKRRVAGFIGQETTHALQHRRLNEALGRRGYLVQWLERDGGSRPTIFPGWAEQYIPRRAHLALTAAMEHFTAVLAERALSSVELQAIPGDPEVWALLDWHALEELEHKSVAFDVFRSVGGSELLRLAAMGVALPLTLLTAVGVTGASLLWDPVARRHPVRLLREAWGLARGPLLRDFVVASVKYLRPGFHPDDVDTSALVARWERQLFGAGGELVGHLR